MQGHIDLIRSVISVHRTSRRRYAAKHPYFVLLILILTQAFSGVRVYALWNRNLKLSIVVFLLLLPPVVVNTVRPH